MRAAGMRNGVLSLAGTIVCMGLSAGADCIMPGGTVGTKAGRLFSARLNGPKARGDIFNETVRAFQTHYDDCHGDPAGPFGPWGYWQGEYWGKTMLSYCAHQRMTGDAGELAFIRRQALNLVETFQRDDGYLATYGNPDFVVGWNWNVWGRKYTIWALVEAYDLTKEDRLLHAAVKMVGHLRLQLSRLGIGLAGTGCFAGLPSMSILKPVLLLHERTGDRDCLQLAEEIVADNDRLDGRKPNLVANAFSEKPVHLWYPESQEWAKAYEFMSCVEGLIEFSRVTGQHRALEAAKRIFDKLVACEMNGVCSVGYHDKFVAAASRPNAISENCDVIHWMRLCRYLYEAAGDARYLDHWERCFYNAFLAGIFRSGEWGAHDVRGHGRRHLQGLYEVNMIYHFCCLDNAPRGFVDWFENILVARSEDLFDVNFYCDGTFRRKDVEVVISGNYPVGDKVSVSIKAPRTVRFGFRIPDWAFGMTIDGKPTVGRRQVVEVVSGSRTISLDFAMQPRLEAWKGSDGAVHDQKLAEYLRSCFEMPEHNKEMTGLMRTKPGLRILRGPLLLAKCQRAGDDDATCLGDLDVDESWQVKLTPCESKDTWGCWKVDFTKGGDVKSVMASDFATAADSDDWRNAFSIWF